MTVMLRVAERGGFTAAAEDVGLTPSAVAKVVGRLEQRLGVRLLNRTTRRVTLTSEGERYVEHGRRILADIEGFEADLASHGATARGRLRVSCGTAIGVDLILRALPEFLAQYPDIELDFQLSDTRLDLVEEQIDVALRLGTLADSSLVARRLCRFERIICAAPSYLGKAGTIETPDDLLARECLFISAHPGLNAWPFRTENGSRLIEVRGRTRFNIASAVFAACIAGLGVARLADILALPEIRAGRLVPLLTEVHDPQRVELTALMPAGRQHAPKVRVFLDFLVQLFAISR
jgi:DNA-binding transcriptional LysR family regulator